MISYDEFGALRLAQFLPDEELAELEGWEYEERLWVGEAFGFSEWLREEDEPEVLGSLSIDFGTFPGPAAERVLRAIDLPLRPGMADDDVRAALGEPVKTYRFADDRVTHEFLTPEPARYNVSCTVLHQGGLTFLAVMMPRDEPGED